MTRPAYCLSRPRFIRCRCAAPPKRSVCGLKHRIGLRKGLDPNTVPDAASRAIDLIQRLAGADVYRGMVDVYPEPVTPWTVRCRPARVRKVLGADVSDEQIASISVRCNST